MSQWTSSGGISQEDAETMLHILKKMGGSFFLYRITPRYQTFMLGCSGETRL